MIISASRLQATSATPLAELATSSKRANLAIKDTPHNNFRATIEVPTTTDLTVHLSAGNLEIAPITGDKDIDVQVGDVGISIPNSNDYATVDADVKVGNINAGPLVIRVQDFPRTSNGQAPASTRCTPVSAPATWN
jgi:hypothetical protein